MSLRITNFTQLLDCPKQLIANDILQVNSDGTAIDVISSSSLIPPVIGTGVSGDIATFTGGIPILQDSNLHVDHNSGNMVISPSNNADGLKLDSQQNVNINCGTSLNLDATSGNINNQCLTHQVTAFNAIQLTANNSVTIQCGANQILMTPTSVQVVCGSGVGFSISNNNNADVWNFSGTASGGTYTMPVSNGLNGSVLTNDGTGVLSWVGGA